MTTVPEIVEQIRAAHRDRRFAMKVQQKLDRSLESYIRINFTQWSPDLDKKERDKLNKEVAAIIKAARAGDGDPRIVVMISSTDEARETFDNMRAEQEKAMEALAKQLPIYPWVESIRGFGALGLATIVAEAGDISKYPNPQKLRKRLGFAPYDGHAGSTWKRESWRERTLTKEEWIANPFSGERYALMHQIVVWLVNSQWIGAAKTGTGEGKPNGHYGQVYFDRRARTAKTHPDWTNKHSQMDALRVTMQSLLTDLWCQWHDKKRIVQSVIDDQEQHDDLSAVTHHADDNQTRFGHRRPHLNGSNPTPSMS